MLEKKENINYFTHQLKPKTMTPKNIYEVTLDIYDSEKGITRRITKEYAASHASIATAMAMTEYFNCNPEYIQTMEVEPSDYSHSEDEREPDMDTRFEEAEFRERN